MLQDIDLHRKKFIPRTERGLQIQLQNTASKKKDNSALPLIPLALAVS